MKSTIKLLLFLGVLFATSCSQPTDMLTVINSDGSCYREFSEYADSAFLRGNTSPDHNPFPVEIDSTWKIGWSFKNSGLRTDFPLSKSTLDSILKLTSKEGSTPKTALSPRLKSKVNNLVFARRNYKSVEGMDTTFRLKKSNEWSLIKVKHRLEKQFRWFYTYYTYRETYPMIKTGFALPIENYMTKDEAQFWFTGKPNILQSMNGLEMREYLGKIEDSYNKWITQNLWNAEYKVLLNNYDSLSKKPVAKEQLQTLKDSIYNSKIKNLDDVDMEKVLNSFFKTDAFSELWKNENSPMKKFEKDFNKKFTFFFSQSFNYKLILPGKIIQSGDAIIHGDTLVWKLSSYRLIPADYVIEAQSRKANVWAFILTGILALVVIASFLWKPKKH
jgi:hypothetical protein